ncbi:MAG: cyclic pyranopterin monophosphate synthase MoaC [Fuerstiella sp.]|nr:cyclic pyranopterin monophosphate synthase MoaC [Fuerstiella sp.]
MNDLTHFDEHGASRMVDVSAKPVTQRMARAEGFVSMKSATLLTIQQKGMSKGDVLEVARLAGIMATKRTDELIPLCHSLGLDSAAISFAFVSDTQLRIESTVSVSGRTGVEMEALTAVSVAALTVYDMCKSIDRDMEITGLRLLEKSGGRSGHYVRPGPDTEGG